MYDVYLLHSQHDQGWYIGYTSRSPEARPALHNDGEVVSTKARRPFQLIYYEAYLEHADAEGRERFLKSGAGRRFLKKQLAHDLAKPPSLT